MIVSMHPVRRSLALLVSLTLLAVACGGSSDPVEPTASAHASAEAETPTARPTAAATAVPSTSAEPGYSWTSPDPFDATFGDGSSVLELGQRLPHLPDLPAGWQPADLGGDDEDAVCLMDEPDAAIEAGWFVAPEDPGALLPHVVALNIEHHGTSERAAEAAAALGSDQWIECQRSELDGVAQNGVSMTTDNPAGEIYASQVQRDGVQARRQLVDAIAFGSSLRLVGDTHVWTEGATLFALFVMGNEDINDELAIQLGDLLRDAPDSEPALLDQTVPSLRLSIERDPEALAFFSQNARAQFLPAVPEELYDCATATVAPPQVIMNGPIWTTPTGASLLIQGGMAFETATDAQAELDRYEAVAQECLVERAKPLLGDTSLVGTNAERITVNGVEVLVVTADLVQLASNDFVARDIDVFAQRVLAVSGTSVIGFGFLGIAGDEPDLVALTAAAVQRMSAE